MFEDVKSFDQLNSLVKNKRSEPYDEYFKEMDISEEQKEERVSLSEDFENAFLPVLILLFTMQQYGMVNWETARQRFDSGYRQAISSHMDIDEHMDLYISQFAYDVIDSTKSHEEDPYYYSLDRAMYLSENESNTSLNYKDFIQAIASGKTKKQWVDVRDKRERKTHLMVGGTVKKITEPFLVGDSLMFFPHDTSMGAEAKELVNCRCSCKYF